MNRIRITPVTGKTYEHKDGERYNCISILNDGAVLQSITTGWTMRCHGIAQYDNGKIDWDYSAGGYFADFNFGIISQTTYEESGYEYKVRITVYNIKLNGEAMNEWIMTNMINQREVYNTLEEWEQYKSKVAQKREEWERKVADILGIKKTEKNGITITQVLSEIFTVVYMENIKD